MITKKNHQILKSQAFQYDVGVIVIYYRVAGCNDTKKFEDH